MDKPKTMTAGLTSGLARRKSADFLSLADLSPPRIEEMMRFAAAIKAYPEQYHRSLEGRVLLMMFQKPSLRTRVSFESAMARLGGHAIAYDLDGSPWGHGRETPADTARTVSHYVDAILARLFCHAELLDLADHAAVPVINGLTDREHPCQVLSDLLTMQERFGRLRGLRLAYVGDGNNNVAHSLLDGCGKMGIHLTLGCPPGAEFEPAQEIQERARGFASESGACLQVVHDARAAVAGAQAVYTDTWMGYHIPSDRRARREQSLRPFRVTADLFRLAAPEAVFMHSLPAWRGQELDAEVIDGPRSIVFAQAENRLYTEKAILLSLIR